MKQVIKSPAPALKKGIQLLERLSEKGQQNLEALARDLDEPKASVLRYLDTLLALDLVEKDPVSKEYTAKIALIRVDSANKDISGKVRKLLDTLSTKTCRTAEWYVLNNDRMVLEQRSEPENAEIHVKARIGFERLLDDEFEAVARTAISNLNIDVSGKKLWVYRQGKKIYIDPAECRKILESDNRNGYAMDMEYNVNGVRRYAAPVFYLGKFAGVIALSENFTPDADRQIAKISKLLMDAIKERFQQTVGLRTS